MNRMGKATYDTNKEYAPCPRLERENLKGYCRATWCRAGIYQGDRSGCRWVVDWISQRTVRSSPFIDVVNDSSLARTESVFG